MTSDYDAWVLRGPEEHLSIIMEACNTCRGTGVSQDSDGEFRCVDCEGTGEAEVTLDEPDGDYEYERRRDAAWEDGE